MIRLFGTTKKLILITAVLMMILVGCGNKSSDSVDIESEEGEFLDPYYQTLEGEKGEANITTNVYRTDETWSVKTVEWLTEDGSKETVMFKAPTELGNKGIVDDKIIMLVNDSENYSFQGLQYGYAENAFENYVYNSSKENWISDVVAGYSYEENGYFDLQIENGILSVIFKISGKDKEGYRRCIVDRDRKIDDIFYYMENSEIYDDSRALTVISSITYWDDNINGIVEDVIDAEPVTGYPSKVSDEMYETFKGGVSNAYKKEYVDDGMLITYVNKEDDTRSIKVFQISNENGEKESIVCDTLTDLQNLDYDGECIELYDNDDNYRLLVTRTEYSEENVNYIKEQWTSGGYTHFPYEENAYYAIWMTEEKDKGMLDVIYKVAGDGYEGYYRYMNNKELETASACLYIEKSEIYDDLRALRTIKSIMTSIE